ncbi:PEP-utilizing enzyme [Myxococcota bacterium]|nr:PEP-utilizing enzyme [Myxococcota bacterium]
MSASPVDPLHRVSGPDTAWTRVNIAEGIPGVSTPLNWSWWDDANDAMVLGAYCDIGVLPAVEIPPASAVDQRTSAIFYGRPALNVDVSRRMADLQPGTSGEALERHYFGAVRPDAPSHASVRRYPAIALKLPFLWRRIPGQLQALYDDCHAWWQQTVAAGPLDDEAAAKGILAEAYRRFCWVARPHSALALLAGALTQQVSRLAERAGHTELLLDALGGYDSVEFETIGDLLEVKQGQLPMAEFLRRRGYQGPQQGELSSVSWREDPTPVERLLESLDVHSVRGQEASLERSNKREAAEAKLCAALGPVDRASARWWFGQAARMLPQRETGKAALTLMIDAARFSLRALGQGHAARGLLEVPDDIFYLTLPEIHAGCEPSAVEQVPARRAQRAEYESLELPESWIGMVEPLPARSGVGGEPLMGLGVSPGVAEGRVRVVLDGSGQLEPGEILVCEATDPSYAGYFLVAAGVVTDIGGAMGHGSIVAREVGIPCVVNTRDASRRLRTGDWIRIDGTTGVIEVEPSGSGAEG